MFQIKTEPQQNGDNPNRKPNKQGYHTANTFEKNNGKTWTF